ncbi:MAG: cell wall-binding repeat-containing protein [Bradymonadaceae bacterium]
MQNLHANLQYPIALTFIVAMAIACGDPELYHGTLGGDSSSEELIDAPPYGEVFDFDYTIDDAPEAIEIDGELQPTALDIGGPFRGIEIFWTGPEPQMEYQIATTDDQWSEWQEFEPQSSYAGMYGGVINLTSPAVGFRFRTIVSPEYLRFEFFEDEVDLGDLDHDHSHEDDSMLFDDDEYMDLDDAESDDYSTRTDELGVRRQELVTSCNKQRMAAYSGGRRLADVTVVSVNHKPVAINTASAFEKMRLDARRSGVNISVVSGFRTMAQQEYFYNCYRTKRCNNGNLAARPGYSNHQDGRALDLNTRGAGVYNWLSRNASRYGFQRTVPSEPWHWEYRAGVKVSPQVCSAPAPPPPPTYNMNIGVKVVGLTNFYNQGSSNKLPDALVGDRFQAEVLVTNRSSVRVGPVRMGYWFEHPHMKAVGYRIDTDSPHHNRRSWRVNSANSDTKNPAKSNMGRNGTLEIHSFAPGETKRVLIDLEATQYSIGRADHPDVRVWIRHISNVYGEQTSFGGTPTTNKIGRVLRAHAELDVLKADEWQFGSKKNRRDLEGWTACHGGHHDELLHNTNHGLMSMRVTGNNACTQSPSWTSIDAQKYDRLVLGVRSHDGVHTKTVGWAPESCPSVDRLSGANRFATSAAVSRDHFPNGAPAAVLVMGNKVSSDAIVAGPLANHLGGPVLLTGQHTLPSAVATELRRLNPAKVVIVGGPLAVSADVVRTVQALGLRTERVSGYSRYNTAAAVARTMGAPDREALIVAGENAHLIDGVVASSLAANLNMPILLVNGNTIDADTRKALTDLGIQRTIVVGGAAAVSDAVFRQLPNPRRLSGANRYATAVAVADYAMSRGISADHLYIARADNLIDAFAVTHSGDIILLSPARALHPATEKFLNTRRGRDRALFKPVTLLGGLGALSNHVESSACLAVEGIDNHSVSFEAAGDGTFQNLVIPVGDHPSWNGDIHRLRLYHLHGQRPVAGDSRWYDTRHVFLQSSTTRRTNSGQQAYVTAAPVVLK